MQAAATASSWRLDRRRSGYHVDMPTAGMPRMPGKLIVDHIAFDRLLPRLRRIAVLGIKPESRASRPAHIVPAYLNRAGYEIVPVPVYYPDVTEILGRRV